LSRSARFSGRARPEIAAALEAMGHTAAQRRFRQVIEIAAQRIGQRRLSAAESRRWSTHDIVPDTYWLSRTGGVSRVPTAYC
jgi:hypothetical protein